MKGCGRDSRATAGLRRDYNAAAKRQKRWAIKTEREFPAASLYFKYVPIFIQIYK